jgi:8-amino-7-oxononanoate synthase
MSFITDLESQLITLQQQGAYRQCLSENRPFDIDLTHNDYLNLSTDASVLNASQANLELSKMGSTGSRLLSGQHHLFDTCERLCADYLGMDSGLVFNSGLQLTSGVIPTLTEPQN